MIYEIRKKVGIWLLRPYLNKRLLNNTLHHVESVDKQLWKERYWMGRVTEVTSISYGREQSYIEVKEEINK